MDNNFQLNLKKLTNKYSQKYVAEKTGFSQASINNYLTKSSEPSIQFLIALKNAFGINVDDFLFYELEEKTNIKLDKFVGNFLVYYYNNSSYKGEVHNNIKNTLNYGVLSFVKEKDYEKNISVYGTFIKTRTEALKLLKEVNALSNKEDIMEKHKENNSFYIGELSVNDNSLFIDLSNKSNGDRTFIILNNPPTNNDYIGGIGAVNSIARGREHNPCVQYIILSKKLIDKPDGEIYNCLKLDDYNVNIDYAVSDIITLFKKLYVETNDISMGLTEEQKSAIIENKLEYYISDILDANVFRFAKISNKEDDSIYKLLKEGIDV